LFLRISRLLCRTLDRHSPATTCVAQSLLTILTSTTALIIIVQEPIVNFHTRTDFSIKNDVGIDSILTRFAEITSKVLSGVQCRWQPRRLEGGRFLRKGRCRRLPRHHRTHRGLNSRRDAGLRRGKLGIKKTTDEFQGTKGRKVRGPEEADVFGAILGSFEGTTRDEVGIVVDDH